MQPVLSRWPLVLFALSPALLATPQGPAPDRRWNEDIKTPREPDSLPPFDGKLSSGPRAAERQERRQEPRQERERKAGRAVSRAGGVAARRVDHSVVRWDAPGDGSLWARGTDYKASFDARGATCLPRLGPDAPHDVEIALSPDLVTVGGRELAGRSTPGRSVVSRSGDRVEIDRGTFVERYDLVPGSLEQSFVFGELPAPGDLVLHIPLGGEGTGLELAEAEEGFEVREGSVFCEGEGRSGPCTGAGLVLYGRAVAFDAAGRSIAATTRILDGSVEIQVDAAALAGAALPLVIDPPVVPFPIGPDAGDDGMPDCAFDAVNRRWLVVFDEVFSATDHDAYAELLTETGAHVAGLYVDFSSADWQHIRCANLFTAQQFLVVAAVKVGTETTIRGRTFQAATAAVSNQLLLSNGEFGNLFNPEVGGDGSPTGSSYLVVYQRRFSATDEDILARRIDPNGSGGNTIYLSNSSGTQDIFPEMSKSNGGISWLVAWQRDVDDSSTGIWAGRIDRDGAITAAPFQLINYPFAYIPSVSSPLTGTQKNLVTFESEVGSSSGDSLDVYAFGIDGATTFWSMDVNTQEWDGDPELHQLEPEVDSDGQHFLVTYMQQTFPGSLNYDLYATDIGMIGTNLFVSGPRATVATSPDQDIFPRIASAHGSGGPAYRYLAVWASHDGSQGDILGAFLEGREGGKAFGYCFATAGGAQCPCHNIGEIGNGCGNSVNPSGGHLFADGSLSTIHDTTTLNASGLPTSALALFLQGTNTLQTPVVFGDGLKCIAGSIVRLGAVTSTAGTAVFPPVFQTPISVRGNVPVDGVTRYYTCWYRDNADFCTSATWNLTNGVFIEWAR
jgi:hypothetical protein